MEYIAEIEEITLQLESAARSLETAISKAEKKPDENSLSQVKDCFCEMFEQIRDLNTKITALRGHIKVCDAIYAANDITRMKTKIKRLESTISQLNSRGEKRK